jgi:FkbM family methyltransferase
MKYTNFWLKWTDLFNRSLATIVGTHATPLGHESASVLERRAKPVKLHPTTVEEPFMKRIRLGDLEVSAIDRDDADVRNSYDEVFGAQIYDSGRMRVPERPTIVDVGANIGLYALWAQRRYRPRAIHCYEASPRTFACLQDNIGRLVDPEATRVTAVNRAIAGTAGRTLVLHQSTRISRISTFVEASKVGWIAQAAADRHLETHEIATSTLSAEMAANGLAVVDILKIDVEGYFLEVLHGIAPRDYPNIRNIVVEVDYLPETGIRADRVEAMLQAKGYATDFLDRSQTNNLTLYAWRP